jgi:eukaryotic-like serine/threonine-protein kinase
LSDGARALWQRARLVLDEVMDLAPGERAGAVARVCAGDEMLRREVEGLLAAEAAAEGFLEAAALERAAGLLDERAGLGTASEAAAEGETAPEVPGYRLLRRIGEGGMGEVYLAERTDGHFEQRVALKLLRYAGPASDLHRRFLRERQILARLEHPGIARLLDGGSAADGTPFFALEYVEGEPITSFCESRHLTVEDRLALFAAVCAAVQYAHGRLVVHRDLKPSNILVDADGRPRLLDFGIAKLLDEESSEETSLTRTHMRPMTPEYASPEQVRGEPITTATDVYALGVLLYQLLTGRRPYGGDTRDAMVHAVLTADPPAPSAAAKADPALVRRLRGDVDAIVLTALRKEPERRYASAEALARDVERHLSGHAVSARADTRFYRLGRLLHRHRAAFGGAAVALVALLAGLGVAVVQARRASLEAERAEAVQSFLLSLFSAADPEQSKGRELTARELLRRGEERIETELAGQTETQARLWSEIAAVYLQLGEAGRAEPLARRAATALSARHGASSAAATAARSLLGNALLEAGRIEQAEAEYRSALADETAARGGETATAALLRGGIAGARRQLGDPAGAVAEHRLALATWERLGRGDGPEASDTLNDLSVALADGGHYAEAEDAARRAVAIRVARNGEESAGTLVARYSQAHALYELGRWSEADAIFRRILPVQEKLLGPEHPKVLLTRRQVARLAGLLGRYEDAVRELETIVTQQRAGAGGTDAGYTLEQLTSLRLLQGDLPAAERAGREAIEIFLSRFGEDHADLAWARSTQAEVLLESGRVDEAADLLAQADNAQHAGDPGDDFHARTEVSLGLVALRRGRVADARPHLEAGLEVHRRAGRQQSVARAASLLGQALSAADPARAETLLREALDTAQRALPAGHPDIADVQVALGVFLVDRGRGAAAEPLLRDALATRRARFGDASPRTAEAEARLGLCLVALGRADGGARLVRGARGRLASRPGRYEALLRQIETLRRPTLARS